MPKYEDWFGEQTEEVKAMIEEHYKNLLNSVKATRDERDALSIELKKLAKEVDGNSEAGKQLGELRAKLEASERKSNFIDEAVKQGVIRPQAAFAIANTENLYTEDGKPDWEKIRDSVPELFKVSNTNNNAGSGTSNALPKNNPNQIIRDAAKNNNR